MENSHPERTRFWQSFKSKFQDEKRAKQILDVLSQELPTIPPIDEEIFPGEHPPILTEIGQALLTHKGIVYVAGAVLLAGGAGLAAKKIIDARAQQSEGNPKR